MIDEVLRGSPKTVIGATDQASGQLAVDPNDPASAQIGTILVNARTLATDSGGRDRALKNWILQTNEYEFVTFEPAEVIGMPDSVAVGAAFSFQVAGNLRCATPWSCDLRRYGDAGQRDAAGGRTLTIPHRDLNVSIPDLPSWTRWMTS